MVIKNSSRGFPCFFCREEVTRDYQGEVYLGAGGLTRSSKVRTGSLEAVGRGVKGSQVLCKLSMWPSFAKGDIWDWLGSLFGQSETGLKWCLRESLACRWQMNLCLHMRSPAAAWQVLISNVIYMLGWLLSMHNLSTLQPYVEVSCSTFEPCFARQNCSLLLLIKLLWSGGYIMGVKRLPYPVLWSQIF